jgi:hypothetical protein
LKPFDHLFPRTEFSSQLKSFDALDQRREPRQHQPVIVSNKDPYRFLHLMICAIWAIRESFSS